MIFADKLITLRKKAGWSQEELAEKLNVTRQSVSKWEGAQSVPDIDKILQLSCLFGVTTDYLLKDDAAEPEYTEDDTSPLPRVTLAQANDYLAKARANAPKLALAAALAGGAVSFAGLIGFVGLIVPHIMRLLIGSDHEYLLPCAAIAGGAVVTLADTAARTLFSPLEIPVGIFMSFIGGPFFLYLLKRRMR